MNIKISGSLIKDLFKIVLEKDKEHIPYGRKACPPPPPKKKKSYVR